MTQKKRTTRKSPAAKKSTSRRTGGSKGSGSGVAHQCDEAVDRADSGRFDEAGRRILIQGMLFTVALAFTVLAASIETHDVTRSDSVARVSSWIEVFGWFLLFLSGAAGLGWIYYGGRHYIGLARGENDNSLGGKSSFCQHCHLISLLVGILIVGIARGLVTLWVAASVAVPTLEVDQAGDRPGDSGRGACTETCRQLLLSVREGAI